MGRKIIIASGKGGVGKTTITAGLGKMLSSIGASVVLIDGDVGLSNLDSLLNINGEVVFDLQDLMFRKCRIKQALIPDKKLENLYVIASNKFDVGCDIQDCDRFLEIVNQLASVFDFVLIDSPAGASSIFKMLLAGADEAFVVVTPHTSSLRDADKIISIANAVCSNVSIIVNRMRGDLVISQDMLSHTQIQSLFSKKIIGVIPESDYINIYSSINFDIFKDRECYKSFLCLAENVYNSKNKLYDYKRPYKGIIGYFKRKMKRG